MQTIRLFVEVARCRSFSKAASVFGISQSAASQRIGQLERRLGVKLIDRSVRPFELTQAGELYRIGAVETLGSFDQMERKVSSMGVTPEALGGIVRVSAIYSAGIDLLSQVREDFEKRMPKVSVQIDYLKPDEVYQAVQDQHADLGIVSYPDRYKKVVVHPMRDEVMSVVCNPKHRLAGRKTVGAGELTGVEMVGFDPRLPVAKSIKKYLSENNATPAISHRFDNLDTLKGAVVVTDRFAIIPLRTAQREIEAGSLVAVALTPRLMRPVCIITPRSGPGLSPAARAFMDELLAASGPVPGLASGGDPKRPKQTSP